MTFDSIWKAKAHLRERYHWREVTHLIEMLGASLGKTVADTITAGEISGEYEDGVYALIFTDGTGFMLDHIGGSPRYSSWTPGSPSSVEYFALTPKNA